MTRGDLRAAVWATAFGAEFMAYCNAHGEHGAASSAHRMAQKAVQRFDMIRDADLPIWVPA